MYVRDRNNEPLVLAMFLAACLLLVSSLVNPAIAEAEKSPSNRLVLFQGFILSAYFNDQYFEVKRLPPGGTIYGYGWLDDHRIFVAYQRVGYAEAIADFEVMDLRQRRTGKLEGIGAVGESNFDVNKNTGRIIFSDTSDISELVIAEDAKTYQIRIIKKEVPCWGVFWIDNRTIGCKRIEKNTEVFVKYVVP